MPDERSEAQANRELLAKLAREEDRVRDENEWMRLDQEAEAVAKRAERELRASIPVDAVRWVSPANADPLAPQDPERRARFEERLTLLVQDVLLDLLAWPSESLDDPQTSARERLSGNACTACRGSCCRSGGDHAYLTEETIARYVRAHPERSFQEILDAYVSCIPERTTVNSCIYHSETGCGLPRDLRSSTCNRYLCGKLQALKTSLSEEKPVPVFAVLFDDGRWVRTALIDTAGVTLLAEDPPDAPE